MRRQMSTYLRSGWGQSKEGPWSDIMMEKRTQGDLVRRYTMAYTGRSKAKQGGTKG